MPDDTSIDSYTCELHLHDEAWDKAARVIEEGWKKAPKDERDSLRWRYVYALYKAGRGMRAYIELEGQKEVFQQLANLLVTDKKGAQLQELIASHRRRAADDPDLLYQEARAKILTHQPGEAASLIKRAYEQQPFGQKRNSYVTGFVVTMQEAGQGLEGYRDAPDKAIAFQTLARNLTYARKADELRQLLDEHARTYAADPWHAFYTGEWHFLKGDYERAGQTFSTLLAGVPPRTAGPARKHCHGRA